MPEDPTTPLTGRDLELSAQRTSMAALDLAKRVAAADAVTEDDKAEAADLVAQVKALQEMEPPPSAASVLADARLDLNWVRSDRALPTSTRLHHHLADGGA